MKFCVALPCFFAEDYTNAIKTVASLGFSAVETYNWKELDLDEFSAACNDSGIVFNSFCVSDFRLTDSSYRNVWLDALKETLEAAEKAGVKKLITQVGADTGEERKKQHDNIVTTLSLASSMLEKSGVTVMIEPLNVLVNHKGYYLPGSKEAFDIINEVNSPNVKVIYDIYHQQVSEGNIIDTVTANIKDISHFHAAGCPGRHELQSGENDYKNIFSAIDNTGFDGFCGLEYNPVLPARESLSEFMKIYA